MECRAVRASLFRYVDGELAEPQRAALDRHLAACSACRRLAELERSYRETYILPLGPDAAPPEVRERVLHLLESLASRPPSPQGRPLLRRGLAAGAAVVALGSALWFMATLGQRGTAPIVQLAEAAVEQHQKLVRALLPYDIAQVSPQRAEEWFRRRLDFNVSIPPLPHEHVTLLGGRISHLRDLEVAALHYQVEGKDVSLFILPFEGYRQLGLEESPKFKVVPHKGYDVIVWTSRGLAYSLVSEIGGRACLVCHSADEQLDPVSQAKGHL
jgi:anti-sigma factor (TIGR02949 family)